MKFFKKLLEFFTRTKERIEEIEIEVQAYIKKHSKQLKLIMSILETIFPEGTGIEKMTCLVTTVCTALGLQLTPQIMEIVTNELQKLYDKFKKELEN